MRASGILMHITSLPSPYGIGTMGRAAREFVDFLAAAGQRYWQVLPMNPTGFGDSPYQALSTFAGNPYLIDLDTLIEEGLLTKQEVDCVHWADDPCMVDFDKLYRHRFSVLRLAFARFVPDEAYRAFLKREQEWLPDFARFMALKSTQKGDTWLDWEPSVSLHQQEILPEIDRLYAEEIAFHCFLQYEFFRQWDRLRSYCHERGITVIGDVPIYVPHDSADVWGNPQWFLLDERHVPTLVGGCPPDYFKADGQLWGTPVYNWEALKKDGYRWWLRRLKGAARMYDVIRLDHFRGFESFWAVPYGSPNARNGSWLPGPGMDFFRIVQKEQLAFIAEDLGLLTPAVLELREQTGFPGMRVLEFAFDSGNENLYLPHQYCKNCVCYAGTHDNATVLQWYEGLSEQTRDYVNSYLGLNPQEGVVWGVLRGGMSSVADLFIAQMQDYLALPGTARMNQPGDLNDRNWRWRMAPDAITPALTQRLHELTWRYGRTVC